MDTALDNLINVKEVNESKLPKVDLENLVFGSTFSDHMFEVNYENGNWGEAFIKPYQNMTLSPACSALHYGQAIFEGMKAYRTVPAKDGFSLYLRPYMFANDPYIGVRTSKHYKFIVFTCPVGKYYTKRIKVKVADKYVRAFNGGTGFAKAAGNYAATLYPALLVGKEGFDQVLWTDGYEHKYVQEIGTMNFFCIMDGVAYTPPTDGQILEGVTRASVITLLKDEGFTVKEQPVTIQEIERAFDAGKLDDAFGTGTAASVSPIAEINYNGKAMVINESKSKTRLDDIKYGREEDRFNWMVEVV